MILISDNHEHIVRDPKHIEMVEVDELGFLIKVDGVVMGFTKSYKTALSEMEDIAKAITNEYRHYQIRTSYE